MQRAVMMVLMVKGLWYTTHLPTHLAWRGLNDSQVVLNHLL